MDFIKKGRFIAFLTSCIFLTSCSQIDKDFERAMMEEMSRAQMQAIEDNAQESPQPSAETIYQELLPAPQNIQWRGEYFQTEDAHGVIASWNATAGAAGYQVCFFMRWSDSGIWNKVEERTIQKTNASFSFQDYYSIKLEVCAYQEINGDIVYGNVAESILTKAEIEQLANNVSPNASPNVSPEPEIPEVEVTPSQPTTPESTPEPLDKSKSARQQIKDIIAIAEREDEELEAEVNDYMPQQEMNLHAAKVYETWDTALNDIWAILKDNLDSDKMSALTKKQIEWIQEKEAAADAEAKQFEGGTMAPLLWYSTAARFTKERVYYLANQLE